MDAKSHMLTNAVVKDQTMEKFFMVLKFSAIEKGNITSLATYTCISFLSKESLVKGIKVIATAYAVFTSLDDKTMRYLHFPFSSQMFSLTMQNEKTTIIIKEHYNIATDMEQIIDK